MIGDWKASIYGIGGDRTDIHLFLDHNGQFQFKMTKDNVAIYDTSGDWLLVENNEVLQLNPKIPEKDCYFPNRWSIHTINTLEDTNTFIVLRQAILASRNLPILFYRVHENDRAYGTDWLKILNGQNAE